MNRYMGIDFGLKRVGIALSDPLKITARPLKTFQNSDFLIGELKNEIIYHTVEKVIIGYPDLSSNNEELIASIDNLILELNIIDDLDVIKWDEAYSSKSAMSKMLAAGKKKNFRKVKENLDAFAAAEILTDFLNNNHK